MAAQDTGDMENMSKSMYTAYNVAKTGSVWVRASKALIGRLAAPLPVQMGLSADRAEPVHLLDNAAGAGVMAQEVHALLPRATLEKGSILCTDLSPTLVDVAKGRVESEGWINTEVKVADAQDTKLPDNSFTHVSICLGLHIMPDPDSAVKEAIRVLKPGGVFGATTFPEHQEGHRFWFDDMRSAFAAMPFEAPFPEKMPMQMHSSGHWTDPAWIEGHLASLGLTGIEVTVRPGTYRVQGADDFVDFFGMMLGAFLGMFWTEAQRAAHSEEELRGLIRDHLVEKHGGGGWDIAWEVIYMTGRVDK